MRRVVGASAVLVTVTHPSAIAACPAAREPAATLWLGVARLATEAANFVALAGAVLSHMPVACALVARRVGTMGPRMVSVTPAAVRARAVSADMPHSVAEIATDDDSPDFVGASPPGMPHLATLKAPIDARRRAGALISIMPSPSAQRAPGGTPGHETRVGEGWRRSSR